MAQFASEVASNMPDITKYRTQLDECGLDTTLKCGLAPLGYMWSVEALQTSLTYAGFPPSEIMTLVADTLSAAADVIEKYDALEACLKPSSCLPERSYFDMAVDHMTDTLAAWSPYGV